MNLVPKKIQNAATDNSNIINGNENTITYNHTEFTFGSGAKATASVSLIYEVCKLISETDFEITEEYSIKKNSEWEEKISYNEIEIYKVIFQDQYYSYDKVGMALKQIPKRDLLVRNVRTIYQKQKLKSANNDEILEKVFNELSHLVITSGIKNGHELYEEEKNDAIYSVMFYAFTKCQLLEPVPDGWVLSND